MKNNIASFISISIIVIILFSSCGLMYKTLLGVDITPEFNTDSDIMAQAKKYDIPSEYNLILDTVTYRQGLINIIKDEMSKAGITDKESNEYVKLTKVFNDDNQPVQFRLFDNTGTEIFKIVNCYIDKPIKSDWNVEKCFDKFPPYLDNKILNTHLFGLDFILDNAYLLSSNRYNLNDLPSSDYYGVIMWNEYMKKPPRKLIKEVRKKIIDENISMTLLYINTQNASIWPHLDSEQKAQVKAELNVMDSE